MMGDLGSLCSGEHHESFRMPETGVSTYRAPGTERGHMYCDRRSGDSYTIYLFGMTMLKLYASKSGSRGFLRQTLNQIDPNNPIRGELMATVKYAARQDGIDISKYTNLMENHATLTIDSILQ